MYEERKEKFSFKSFFITLLIVLLFVLLMLFLFPTRWDFDKKFNGTNTYDLDRLSVLYDEIFTNNVMRMKEAAIGYFTNERMPQKVGESKKLTLQEMYDLHLVLKMKDKDGKSCDVTKSYVEMTKFTEEYRLKVNLSCGNQKDYIIVYLGCYSYCSNGVCEKVSSVPSKKTAEEEKKYDKKEEKEDKYYCKEVNGKYYDNKGNTVSKSEYDKACTVPIPIVTKYYCKEVNGKYYDNKGNVVSKSEYDKACTSEEKKYMYEYKLTTDDSTTCGNWSSWTKTPIMETSNIKVETKTEKEVTGYTTKQVQTGNKVQKTTKKVKEAYISGTTTKLVVTGTKQVQTGTTVKTTYEKVAAGTIERYSGVGSGTVVPKDTNTTTYKVISVDKPESCSYCENETKYIWEIYTKETVYNVVPKEETIPVYKTYNVYEKQEVPIWDYRIVDKVEIIKIPIYKEEKIYEYGNIQYYRSKTCTLIPGTTDIKWSNSKNDMNLIKKGYKFTGNVKQV